MSCNDTLGTIKNVILFKSYDHIMSKKIRHYLLKKQFIDFGFSEDVSTQIANDKVYGY